MATIKPKPGLQDFIVSNLHGKVGGLVFKQVNGKTIIASRPMEFNTPQDPESIARRNRFRTVCTFATFISSRPLLKTIWKETLAPGLNARTRIIKYNYHLIEENWPTVKNIITPPGDQFNITGTLSEEGTLKLEITDLYEPQQDFYILAVLAEYDPVRPRARKKFIMTDYSSISGSELTAHIYLNGSFRYRKYILYTAVLQLREDKLQWSKTLAFEGEYSRGRRTEDHVAQAFQPVSAAGRMDGSMR